MISLQALHRQVLALERRRSTVFDQQRYTALHARVILDGEPLDPADVSPEAEMVRRFAGAIAAIGRVQEGRSDEDYDAQDTSEAEAQPA